MRWDYCSFGVALAPVPVVIPVFKVWKTLGNQKTGKRLPPVIRNGSLVSVPKGTYQGVWRVKSVKNTATGIQLAIDSVTAVATSENARGNARLPTLIRDGMKLLEPRYTGINLCPITSSTSPNRMPSSP